MEPSGFFDRLLVAARRPGRPAGHRRRSAEHATVTAAASSRNRRRISILRALSGRRPASPRRTAAACSGPGSGRCRSPRSPRPACRCGGHRVPLRDVVAVLDRRGRSGHHRRSGRVADVAAQAELLDLVAGDRVADPAQLRVRGDGGQRGSAGSAARLAAITASQNLRYAASTGSPAALGSAVGVAVVGAAGGRAGGEIRRAAARWSRPPYRRRARRRELPSVSADALALPPVSGDSSGGS